MWSFSQILFILLFILLMSLGYNLIITATALLLRIVSYLLITKLSMNRLNEKKLLVFSPIAELLLMIFYPLLSIVNMISKPDKWK